MSDTTDATKTNGSVIDLAEFDVRSAAEQGAAMEIHSPVTGEVLRHDDGRPFTITVLGRDSERFLKLARAQSDRRIQATLRTRQPAATVSVERDDIELLVNATTGWDMVLGGEVPKFSAEKCREVYTKYPFLREQVDAFVGNRANFLKG